MDLDYGVEGTAELKSKALVFLFDVVSGARVGLFFVSSPVKYVITNCANGCTSYLFLTPLGGPLGDPSADSSVLIPLFCSSTYGFCFLVRLIAWTIVKKVG